MESDKQEIIFLVKLIFVIVGASILSFGILYLFMDKWVGSDYRTAFQVISDSYRVMNYYIAFAVLLQFIFSSVVVYLLALHYSHKIAGPIYRLKMVIQQYLKGEDIEKVIFRKTDFLQEISKRFTDFFYCLKDREKLFGEAKELLENADLTDESKKQDVLLKIKKLISEVE